MEGAASTPPPPAKKALTQQEDIDAYKACIKSALAGRSLSFGDLSNDVETCRTAAGLPFDGGDLG